VHEDLRRESAAFISSLPFTGYAVGGVSVGSRRRCSTRWSRSRRL
jgi:tRNA-guanine family transglycosylase